MTPDDHAIAAAQRSHLRRILATFVIVVVLLPLVAFGGRWALLLLPLLVVAGWGAREAVHLRRSMREHGPRR